MTQNIITFVAPTPVMQRAADVATLPTGRVLRSPRVGRLKLAMAQDGQTVFVRKGQLLGRIEALGLSWPVTATADGHVRAVHSHDGDVVEYGQPLFELDEAASGAPARVAWPTNLRAFRQICCPANMGRTPNMRGGVR